jgi:hypothetical protein
LRKTTHAAEVDTMIETAVDWSQPSRFQLKALFEALLFAYPSLNEFATFLMLELGRSYGHIAAREIPYRDGLLQLLIAARGDGWLDQIVQRAIADKPRSPKLELLARTYPLVADDHVPSAVGSSLEELVRQNAGFADLHQFLAALDKIASRVCRIEQPLGQARGTGWLVYSDLVLTNWHVVRDALSGAEDPADVALRFDYGTREGAVAKGRVVRLVGDKWCVANSPAAEREMGTGGSGPSAGHLDYALLRLAERVGEQRGWIDIKIGPTLPVDRDILFVVQHPDGRPVKLAAGTSRGLSGDGWRLFHDVDTLPGSSGSPVFDFASQRVVALHHAGDVLYHETHLGEPERNQAIPIAHIHTALRQQGAVPFESN